MVTVFAVKVKNRETQMEEIAPHKGTDNWIALIKGKKIEGTGEEVDASFVDLNGQYNPDVAV